MGCINQRPEMLAIETKMAHAVKKLKKAEAATVEIERDLAKKGDELAGLEKDHATVTKAARKHKGSILAVFHRVA